jgi:hypothetical protein
VKEFVFPVLNGIDSTLEADTLKVSVMSVGGLYHGPSDEIVRGQKRSQTLNRESMPQPIGSQQEMVDSRVSVR